jgi:hypothetical protein
VTPSPFPDNQRCARCSSPGPFRSPTALKCVLCDTATTEERSVYFRDYQKAKRAAVRTLTENHQSEFDDLFYNERLKLKRSRARALAAAEKLAEGSSS